MRTIRIRRFPGDRLQITDLQFLIKQRLIDDRVVWPDQSLPLVGYMAWPSDPTMRRRWLNAHRPRIDEPAMDMLVRKLKIIQQHWARVADIVHLHYDLAQGRHQEQRVGPSVGKAISLVAAKAKNKGTGSA